jgi:type IV pilus assembly protein PilB
MPSIIGGLARRLISDNLIDGPEANNAINLAAKAQIPFVTHLVTSNLLDSRSIAVSAAEEFGHPLLDLEAFDPDQFPANLIDPKLIRKHNLLPLFRKANCLYLAASDPANLAAFDEIKFHTGINNDVIVVEESLLATAIDQFLQKQGTETACIEQLGQLNSEILELEVVADEKPEDESSLADEAPIVRFVNKLLLDAIHRSASDIHIEPYEKACRVRYRIDGILQEISRPPIKLASRISSRIKVMAQLDISERRAPQDGRLKVKISHSQAIDFRVNTLPTLWGEKIVLRILDPAAAQLGIDALGYEAVQRQQFLTALHHSQGLILATGPTGSGKTVSLYTGLDILNTQARNISTVEDPVEINLEGINQVSINDSTGLDFATTLRAFLRQDPDVIMVGEIRDRETAEIAIRAAQTGHTVLSTLHTNNAAETLTRLQNLGIPAFSLATSISLIVAQRLARKLCNTCKESVQIPEKVLIAEGFDKDSLPHLKLYRAVGCSNCNEGYKSRIGIYEVVPIIDALSRIIMDGASSIQIADQMQKEGFNNLRQSALLKVAQGLISLEEANRIT